MLLLLWRRIGFRKILSMKRLLTLNGFMGNWNRADTVSLKTVTDFRGTGDYTDYTYTAEFCIKEEMWYLV